MESGFLKKKKVKKEKYQSVSFSGDLRASQGMI